MAITRRTRKRPANTGSVEDLNALVSTLIKENTQLKRKLARAEAKSTGTAASTAQRGLRAIARKVERALAPTGASTRRRRRGAGSATASRTRKASTPRKPASPETQAKRLAALARAREARAAKQAAAAG